MGVNSDVNLKSWTDPLANIIMVVTDGIEINEISCPEKRVHHTDSKQKVDFRQFAELDQK